MLIGGVAVGGGLSVGVGVMVGGTVGVAVGIAVAIAVAVGVTEAVGGAAGVGVGLGVQTQPVIVNNNPTVYIRRNNLPMGMATLLFICPRVMDNEKQR